MQQDDQALPQAILGVFEYVPLQAQCRLLSTRAALIDTLGKKEPEFGSYAGQPGTGHGV